MQLTIASINDRPLFSCLTANVDISLTTLFTVILRQTPVKSFRNITNIHADFLQILRYVAVFQRYRTLTIECNSVATCPFVFER